MVNLIVVPIRARGKLFDITFKEGDDRAAGSSLSTTSTQSTSSRSRYGDNVGANKSSSSQATRK